MSADGWCMAQAKRKGSKSGDDSKPSTSATGASGDDSSDAEVDEEVLKEGTSDSSSDDEDGGLVPEAEPGKVELPHSAFLGKAACICCHEKSRAAP